MRKSWLLCVFLATAFAWGQAAPQAPPPAPAQQPGENDREANENKEAAPATEVPENAVVLTINGVCPATASSSASKTAASKTAGAKTAAAKKPADCKTEITRAQFEKIANGLSPNLTPQLKHQLETVLPRFMAMSEAAKKEGLDKTPRFQELIKVVRMQVLTQELQRSVQEKADKISAEDEDKYYKDHADTFEQFSLDRLFVPRFKQAPPPEKDAQELTEDQRKAKEAADKTRQEQGEQEMTKLADTLRAQAASGEDFMKLQKQAFEAAGEKVDNPTVNLPKVRRSGLPPAHAAVFDLKVGEVSQVISDNGGHYVYKVVSKDTLPLDQVKDEIHNKLKSERMKEMMDKYTNSFEAVPNEAYFGPATPPGRPGQLAPHMRPHMAPPGSQAPPAASPQNAPQQTPPPASNPPQPPAAQTPPSNPQ